MASDINPRTGTFTQAGMLLGNEPYPEGIQNAVAHNTGYLLYSPKILGLSAEPWNIPTSPGTRYGLAYLAAGTYDIQVGFNFAIGTGAFGSAYATVDGTNALTAEIAGSYNGIYTSGTVPNFISAGTWHDIRVVANGTGNAALNGWSIQTRQVAGV